MPLITRADTTVHHLHGATFTSYVAPATGSAQLCAWQVTIAAGTAGQPHRVSHEEVLRVTAGRAEVTLDGVRHIASQGDVVLVPAGASLQLDNPGPLEVDAWVTTSVGLEAQLSDGTHLVPPWVR